MTASAGPEASGFKAPSFGLQASGPLFVQLLSLLLVSVIGAQIISILIIFMIPPPGPEVYRLSEVAQALQTGSGGNRFTVSVSQAPPSSSRARDEGRRGAQMRAYELSRQLNVDPQRVRVVEHRTAALLMPMFRIEGRWAPPGPDGPGPAGPGGEPRGTGRGGGPPPPGGRSHPEFGALFGQFEASLQRPDNTWITVQPRPGRFPSPWQKRVLIWLVACAVLFAPIAFLFARRLARPISAFADAAERLGRNPRAPALAVTGPAEVQVAMGAFNQMQDRLRRYIDDRTAMIGAVAHDLRTPLTRMRFMLEGRPEAERERMEREIDEMDAMISATLAFVKDASAERDRVRLDLGALVESLVGDMSETDRGLVCQACPKVLMWGDPVALRRLFTNLLTNAVKFAGGAEVTVSVDDGEALVTVEDRGPGAPESELEQLFEPFYRMESSRNRETGGIGLGLAVVRSIARAHGGEASLTNRPGGGLRCEVRLPLDWGES